MRTERYHRLARQYFELAKQASSPSRRAYYQRIAEDYRIRAQGEFRVLKAGRPSSAAKRSSLSLKSPGVGGGNRRLSVGSPQLAKAKAMAGRAGPPVRMQS
jgi:hypothetical protein